MQTQPNIIINCKVLCHTLEWMLLLDATSGHYVTYIHTCAGWTLFDDSNVREVSETEVLRQQAYILFYQKTDDVSSAVQVSLTN